jgi:nucleotide-binding universal stress UspA family protein
LRETGGFFAIKEFLMTVAELKRTSQVFKNILVATDFSEASRRALQGALALFSESDARISVVHALARAPQQYSTLENPPELDARVEAEQNMNEFVKALDSDRSFQAGVYAGKVADVVADLIKQEKFDLLVIGTRSREGISKLALGSVAEQLLRIATCPVLTIGPRTEFGTAATAMEFRRILFATDFGAASAKALPLALALARANQAKLILLHVTAPMPGVSAGLSAYAPASLATEEIAEWQTMTHRESLRRMKEALPQDTGLEQEPEFIVGTELLPEGILTVAAKRDVDLIAMGANHSASPRLAAHIPWSVVHEVVRDATCPVLTVAG